MEKNASQINDKNIMVYSDLKEVKQYTVHVANSLKKPEQAILSNIDNSIKNKKILDIGVGGGRTTKYLTSISNEYIGIDYSSKMIEECKIAFPNQTFFLCDVRDMSMFGNDEFDLVMFSFNGIDYISQDDRIKGLKEIFRILRPGGYFVFSAHNIDQKDLNKFKFVLGRNLVMMPYWNIYNYINHIKNKKFEQHTETYSIINDRAHNYRLLTYYISQKNQVDQLRDIGFSGKVAAYNLSGEIITDSGSNEAYIYYCVRK